MSTKFGIAIVLLLTIPATCAHGQVFRDDFDAAHDYSTGTVPGGGIWTGVHNPTAGEGTFDANTTTPGNLTMGTNLVGWGGGGETSSRVLYRNVNSDDLREVRLRISAQSVGAWSMAGTIIRKPGPIDTTGANDNFATYASFRAGTDVDTTAALGVNGMSATVQDVTNGGEAENNSTDLNLTEADLEYLRLVHLGTGDFQTYASTDGVNWGDPIQTFNNNALAEGIVEVGLWGGTFASMDGIPGAMAAFDFVEIEQGPDDPEDMAIWDTAATSASWNRSFWVDEEDNGLGVKPDSNVSVAVFGDVLNDDMENIRTDPGTIYTNTDVTVKEMRFDTTIGYTIGGAGSITLASDTGTAAINVNAGTHEIQADLVLANNTNATAAGGATLNINADVDLAGNTLSINGDVNLNNAVVLGGGTLNMGAGSLTGLGGVVGDLSLGEAGSLAVQAGGPAINVTGTAQLAGTLDVSLGDGVSPTKGEVYTILTAGSLSADGLSLGAGADLFDLVVGGNSLSLQAAIPEPSTFCLFGLVLAAGMIGRRRGRSRFRLQARGLVVFAVALVTFVSTAATVRAQCPADVCGTFIDEFEDVPDPMDPMAGFDYTQGMVPEGGIWDGVWNESNGGDPSSPDTSAIWVSNGSDFFGVHRPGVLFQEDLVLHPTTDGNSGIGWGDGTQTSAPLLYREVPAENDWEATIKIDNQTNGNWSYGAIVARVAGPIPGQTPGDPDAEGEAYVTVGNFAINADDPLASDILTQNIFDGLEQDEFRQGAAAIARPIWIRMTKTGGQFAPSFSVDGETFTEYDPDDFPGLQPVVNPQLNVAGTMLQIGPSFMTFVGGAGGEIEIDSFQIDVTLSPTPTMSNWTPQASGNGSGDWNSANNWTSDVPGVIPGVGTGQKVHVTLGDVLPGPSTVVANEDFAIPTMTIDSPNSYSISGSGGIIMTPNAESLEQPTLTQIDVDAGSHEIQAHLSIAPEAVNNNHINVAADAELNINNTFNLNGKQVFVHGDGVVNVNNNVDMGAGTLIAAGGTVGGNGRVNGGLTNGNAQNPGGTVSPGTSVGTLTVDGTYNQHSSSTLEIELAGIDPGEFDVLAVNGLAILDGFVDVSLVDGFMPEIGDMFEFLTATTNIVDTNVIELVPADVPFYELMRVGNNYVLEVIDTPGGLAGDYNDDGVVNAADYVAWRNGGPLANDLTPGVQPEDYDVWVEHFGETAGSGTAASDAAVPEPACWAVVLVAVALGSATGRFPRT